MDAHKRGVAGVGKQPSSLTKVGKQQADLNERPGGVDVSATHMAHVGIEGLGAGGGKEAAAQDHDARVVVGREQERDAFKRVERKQNDGVAQDKEQAGAAQEQEPQGHDGAKGAADLGGAHVLNQEQRDDDCKCDDDHVGLRRTDDRLHGRDGSQTFDGGGDGHRGGEDTIGQKRSAAQHGGDDEPLAKTTYQAVEGKDAAFAVVVGLHADQHILNGGKQRDRPDHKRKGAQDKLLVHRGDATVAGNERLGDVHRGRSDVAVHHAERDEHGREADRDCVRISVAHGCGLSLFAHVASFLLLPSQPPYQVDIPIEAAVGKRVIA